MKRRSIATSLTLLLAVIVPASAGCGDRTPTTPRDISAVERQEGAEKTDATQTPQESQSSDDVDALSDAASALRQTTSQFVGVFSDEDGEEGVAGGGTESDSGGIDMSLVDDETKRKYSDDRTLIAPTLSERSAETADAPKYRLEYKFTPNSDLAWNVVHLVRKRVSYGGVERLIETSSTTWRRWEFQDALPDGRIMAHHWIDKMVLQQREEGKDPIDYDSDRDVVVPKEIASFGTEKAIGVVLETFGIDVHGVMSDKKRLVAEYHGREGDSNVMVPFPDEEIAVGDVWTIPYTLYLKGSDDLPRACRIVERFRLDQIDDKYATITFKTTLVSIVDDPVVEGALAERLFTGRTLFDRELGQTLRTELTFKKSVPGAFGFASYMDYSCQVVEKLDREKSGLSGSNSTQDLEDENSRLTSGQN
ncbi:MAG: hypothetical protein ACOX0A_06505 [Thermoguttaceae bacterium]|jgi:hypothetical protein